jgi:hypothetical protein
MRSILVVLAVVCVLVVLRFEPMSGITVLLVSVSFALVGTGNRLLWMLILPLIACVLAALIYGVFSVLPKQPDLPSAILGFVLVPVIPSLILWAAVAFRQKRASSKEPLSAEKLEKFE